FRPGKAPRRLLEARLGTDIAREQALQDALPEYYVDAVNEHDVDVIAPPEIEITAGKDDGDVEFDAVVEVRPQVKLVGYDELRVMVKEAKQKVLPDLTDEWVKEASEFETVDELRADIRKRVETMQRLQAQMALRDKVLEAAADLVPIEAPPTLVDAETRRRIE